MKPNTEDDEIDALLEKVSKIVIIVCLSILGLGVIWVISKGAQP